eukprot:TRINITY_DN56716_c0_g1_i1.p1 TRINITY_DN56716_c0_g1~~TRINITY_DN56716_c0_g1_i1.p1  ORF type:complete len:295 (+),score=81.00 TRINITY_DN56716_c0_g1_i1:84-968(+)
MPGQARGSDLRGRDDTPEGPPHADLDAGDDADLRDPSAAAPPVHREDSASFLPGAAGAAPAPADDRDGGSSGGPQRRDGPPRRAEVAAHLAQEGRLSAEQAAHLREVWRGAGGGSAMQALGSAQLRQVLAKLDGDNPPDESDVADLQMRFGRGGELGLDWETFEEAMLHWYAAGSSHSAPQSPTAADRRSKSKRLSGGAGQLSGKEAQLVHETFKRYDKDDTGKIWRNELRDMMTDLNSGICPTQQEVDHVMWFADTSGNGYLTEPEFEQAVTFWYIHTMEERERTRSHCCTVL